MADKINSLLTSGKSVTVSTMTNAVRYTAKHAGWFRMNGENLEVRHGRGWNKLSIGRCLLVKITHDE